MTRSPAPAGPTVLVVEDDEALTALVQDVLEAEGFRVVVATRGDTAIAAIEHVRPDVALVDKELPGTGGLDLVEYLARRLPGLPIIFMTAFGGHLVARAAHDRGAAMYLDKPVRLDTLVATVGAAVTRTPRLPPAPPTSAPGPSGAARGAVDAPWGVVVVRPEAARLEAVVRRVDGVWPPGSPGLLRRALERLRAVVPRARTVVVADARVARDMAAELADPAAPRLLVEPADRGSAARTLYPVHWIARHEPAATVVVVPHDHAVGDDRVLAAALETAVAFVRDEPGWVVLLGVRTAEADPGGGWIVPGAPVAPPAPLRAVARFVESPSDPEARALHDAGALWSTSVLVARAGVLRDIAAQLLSPLDRALARAVAEEGSEAGRHALRQAYRLVPPASFSVVLQESGPVLAVLPVEGLEWHDWATPRRAAAALRRLGLAVPDEVAAPGRVNPRG